MYKHKNIDKKWQDRWEKAEVFKADDDSSKEKFFALVEFPFPSGAGLHVGHPRSYTALDVITRKRRMEGMNVLYPMGWDAFGLPTENYAIKTGRAPADVTADNIATFKTQLKSLGLGFDWSREINTSDPKYYRWTQWQFLQFFKAGMAYKTEKAINWCVDCKIGLANEEVVNDACERCHGTVEKRNKEQWMIAITKYADRLIDDLKGLDYLDKIKKQQVDWIGRSEGAEVEFEVEGHGSLTIFTTRPDTLFGATYMVLAPEHELINQITTEDRREAVEEYVKEAVAKTEIERGDAEKEKTGVFTGAYAVNPVNNKHIPIWVADYVLMSYGTGAIMAVPAHDARDFAFASKFELPIIEVVRGEGELPRSSDGFAMNSGEFDELCTSECAIKMIKWLEESGKGRVKTNYKLRDWVFSRQRYWGEPIPLIHCEGLCSPETGGWVAVPDADLPVVLPVVEKYEPTDDGESPLAVIEEWVNTKCPQCAGPGKRETDTMPNWAGSSWYFMRYADPYNDEAFADPDKLKYWMPVDWYNGGMEHTTLHLLYSRFWNKFLFDQGLVPFSEPYKKRTSHGLVLAEDGSKMSKSKGNVVNPDDIVKEFGADTLRVYELFMGPFSEPVPWSTNGVVGVRRFLEKVQKISELTADEELETVARALHQTIRKVSVDIENMRFNTAISQMMIFVNLVQKSGKITKESLITFLTLLAPFAPHLANELAENVGHASLLEVNTWPDFNAELAAEKEVNVAVQVNGKLRGTITVPADADQKTVVTSARALENVVKYIEGEPKKVIYVPGRLVNFVI
ncbi:leucine--tRNA ligase [Candidatus Uhrbacteria bacterium CG_4_10_14_0_2_um_filter_41_7]|uniref:Leucine--tRNA ligase n=1 Tax=Candidatus Uhrbacteria bacterium CG_4_9_14_3_um_filter_41_35 TaxID=1975034 RepID=A0A2M7XDZ0_9BACT|nr:MAG: leucine--tRNA ligase [Candidatus Uhrbacteria bacterium CG_4_10_14_0_2_um_filter_41_7]PJA46083.1 MAG: leucine--tRNA ligase [Candidatus Uhrbacteria bacterium CG_4_9_14_3_um_filter_41_35]